MKLNTERVAHELAYANFMASHVTSDYYYGWNVRYETIRSILDDSHISHTVCSIVNNDEVIVTVFIEDERFIYTFNYR